MAVVDFSHAVLEPFSGSPFLTGNVGLKEDATRIADINGDSISTLSSITTKRSVANEVIVQYSGQFTASGTAIYIANNNNPSVHWRISNITFASGDTYNFQIVADLINS
jgi:hypothetical protein